MATKNQWKGKKKAAVPASDLQTDELARGVTAEPEKTEQQAPAGENGPAEKLAEEKLPGETAPVDTSGGELPPRPLDPPGVDVPANPVPAKPAPGPVPPPVPHCRATGGDLEHSATIEELEAVCEGAPAEFLIEQLRARATMKAAVAAWREVCRQAEPALEMGEGVWLRVPMTREKMDRGGYNAKTRLHVDLYLSPADAQTLLLIHNALDRGRVRLSEGRFGHRRGRYVENRGDCIRWLLEQCAAQFAATAPPIVVQPAAEPAKSDPAG